MENFWIMKKKKMKSMFNGCRSLKNLPDISKWNTSNVTNMMYMFKCCSSLQNLPDISSWNMEKVTKNEEMFDNCGKS